MKGVRLTLALCVIGGVLVFGTERRGRATTHIAEAELAPVEQVTTSVGTEVPRTPDDIVATPANLAVKTPTTPANRASGSCPEGMIEVEGDYCPNVEQKCLRWLDPETHMRCAEFAPTGSCQGRTTHKRFCIDRFEYPNQPGEKPVVMKTWYEAKATCEGMGKRLCGESEWTLACEGQEHLPYPYGQARSAEACNIDKPYILPDEKAIANPATRDAEVARLDQREPSGVRESCVSPYGVHDMTGNVDEWVVNENGRPYQSGLKGGYWGPVRTRCRPMTTAHNEDFSFYQIGFRCCGEVEGASKKGVPGAPGVSTRAKSDKADGINGGAKSKSVPAT